jgi:ribosomal protein L11 methyltransferase
VETGAVKVSVFLERKRAQAGRWRAEILAGIEDLGACGLETGPGRVSIRTLPPEDWAQSWKRHFPPIEIGPRLLIRPSWSRRRPRPGQALVVIDPGLSFGTGQHPTTAYCLKQLARNRQPGQRQSCLDVGCGSGILAIAAAKLGYAPVAGFDLDPEAVRIARSNAAENRVAVRFHRADVGQLPLRGRGRFDVVCANLTSDLLLAQAPRLAGQLSRPGLLVVAGILTGQFAAVRAACEAMGLRLEGQQSVREWCSAGFRWV